MNMATQDLEIIKSEVAGIRDFYQARMDAEIPPIREEVQRISSQLSRLQETTKEGQKRSILAKYVDRGRPRVPYGKYEGMDLLDLACVRSLLNSQMRQPMGLNPRMLEEWQLNLKAAMDSTTAGSGDELVPTQEAAALWLDVNSGDDGGAIVLPHRDALGPLRHTPAAWRRELVSGHGELGGHRLGVGYGQADADII